MRETKPVGGPRSNSSSRTPRVRTERVKTRGGWISVEARRRFDGKRGVRSTQVRCAYCARYVLPRERTIDHVRPRSQVGSRRDNVVMACPGCNNAKGDMHVGDFLREHGFEISESLQRVLDRDPNFAREVKQRARGGQLVAIDGGAGNE